MESTFLHLFQVRCNLTGRNAVKTENEVFFIVFSVLSKPQIKKKLKAHAKRAGIFRGMVLVIMVSAVVAIFFEIFPSPILDFAMFGR